MKFINKAIRRIIFTNFDEIKRLMISKNDIELINYISTLNKGLGSVGLSKYRNITIENASTKLLKLYRQEYLSRDELKSISGGIEYVYSINLNS